LAEPADARITRVAEAILRYLARHPDAADSEQGIAAWWMPAVGLETSVDEVAAALEWLHRGDEIERQAMPDGRVIYRSIADGRKDHGNS
jgi:hypothetical protein